MGIRHRPYAPTLRGIIIKRAVSASLAALRAMPPGSRPMLSVTKGRLQPGAAPGCGRSRAHLRRRADAPRDRWAIAKRHFVRRQCETALCGGRRKPSPGLGRDPSSAHTRASAAQLRPGVQRLRGPGIATRVPSVPHDCRPNAVECGGLSAAKARSRAPRDHVGCGCVVWSVQCAFGCVRVHAKERVSTEGEGRARPPRDATRGIEGPVLLAGV